MPNTGKPPVNVHTTKICFTELYFTHPSSDYWLFVYLRTVGLLFDNFVCQSHYMEPCEISMGILYCLELGAWHLGPSVCW